MRIRELIAQLEDVEKKHGNLKVSVQAWDIYSFEGIRVIEDNDVKELIISGDY